MRHLRSDINRIGSGRQRVQVLLETLPLPLDALVQGRAGNILDAFQKANQKIVVIRSGRRKTDTAVAHQYRRHAMLRRGSEQRVPRHLSIIMGMQVDKARCQRQPVGINNLMCRIRHIAYGDDSITEYSNAAFHRWRT